MKPGFAFDVCHGVYRLAREVLDGNLHSIDFEEHDKYLWRPALRPRLAEYAADFELAGKRALASPHLSSRNILFRVFYLGRAELHAARAHLGIGELTWEQWSDDVKARVGRELLRRRMFPPRDYFRDVNEPRTARASQTHRVGTKPQPQRYLDPRYAPKSPQTAPPAKVPKRAQPLFVRDPQRPAKSA
ncbi:MAG TPA: hypothetical protein VLV89_08815 [Candidatus Acidoferrum sp.]|nr:hypothetical protein [Candidatus Acidoferrum sp.]